MAVKLGRNWRGGLLTFGLWLLSAVALCLPFLAYNLGFLALFAPLPLLGYAWRQKARKSPSLTLWRDIWLAGLTSLGVVMFWCLQTSPDRWANITGWAAAIGLVTTYLLLVFVFSTQYLLIGFYLSRKSTDLTAYQTLLILPAIWVVGEAGRSLLLSLLATGPGSSFGLFWNFGVLGVGVAQSPLGYLARLVGMFGLSGLAVLVSLTIFWVVVKKSWKPLIVTISVFFTLSIVAYVAYAPDSGQLTAAYLQYPQAFNGYSETSDFYRQIEQQVSDKADVVVLPEYSEFFSSSENQNDSLVAAQKMTATDGVLISSQEKREDRKKYNQVVEFSPQGQLLASYDKRFLIPIGEYLPSLYRLAFRLFASDVLLKLNEDGREITKSAQPEQLFSWNTLKIGAQACSGANAPELYRQMARGGAGLLTNSASLGIFTGAGSYHAQSQQFARFIAVANARPYVQSAAGAYSYIVDKNGNFVSESHNFDYNYATAELSYGSARTIYTLLGEWTLYIAGIVLLIWGVISWRKSSKKHAPR